MAKTYSIYEAKAKLSEIIRIVKKQQTVTITERGREVARVVPVTKSETLEERIETLTQMGSIHKNPGSHREIQPIVHLPGTLKEFLDSRE